MGRAEKKVTAMKKSKKESNSIIVTYTQPDGTVAKAAVDTELLQPRAVSLDGEPVVWCQRIDKVGSIYAMPGGVTFSVDTPILSFEHAEWLIASISKIADICAGLNSEIEKLKQ